MGLSPSFEPDSGPQTSTSTVPYNPAPIPEPKKKPQLVLPVPPQYANYISQFFGPTSEGLDGPAFGYSNFNKGIDWAVPAGTPISSASDGVVIAVGDQNDGWGISVKVRMSDGRIVNYGHLSETNVKVGQNVSAGMLIGKSGSSGKSTGPHLSFDILEPDGTPVDPSEYFGVNLARDNRNSGSTTSWDTPPRVGMQQREQLKQQRDYLVNLRDALMKEDPSGNASAIAEITKLLIDLDQAIWEIDTYGFPGYQTWAKEAIASKINLGDFELRKAGQVFTEWLNKNASALSAATNQISQAKEWNDMVAQSAGNYLATRNKLPNVLMMPAPFDEAYARWKKELGVGAPPTLTEGVSTDLAPPPATGLPSSSGGPFPEQPAATTSVTVPRPSVPSSDWPSYTDSKGNKLVWNPNTMTFEPATGSQKTDGGNDVWDKVVKGAAAASWLPGSPLGAFRLPLTAAAVAESQGIDVTGALGSAASGAVSAANKVGSWLGNTFVENVKSRKVTKPDREYAKLFEYVGPTRTMSNGQKLYWNGVKYVPKNQLAEDGWAGRMGVRSYAQGGKNIPGGPVIVGEQGPEHIVTPQGQVVPVGQGGPQTAIVPDGVDILPANVPPEQAYLYAKLKQLMQEDLATRDARKMAEAEQRMKDPERDQKFKEAVLRAAAALLAANPPPTPQLVGEWTYDPYYYERQLTGVGPDGLPLNQSQLALPPDPKRAARMQQIQEQQVMMP